MIDETVEEISREHILRITVEIVTAFVSHNQQSSAEIPEIVQTVYNTLSGLANDATKVEPEFRKPAISVRRSVTPDFLFCLEDGRKMKMLKRHLRTSYNLTPDEYRSRWNLPSDYPMVAPNYAKRRSDFAKKIGLGRRSS
ncbi:MAG: MucR family transcriptional regulator [Pseudomonadota bacterium]|nr:MucR family transcriptional regulator [Pseudomonadota bacterium]